MRSSGPGKEQDEHTDRRVTPAGGRAALVGGALVLLGPLRHECRPALKRDAELFCRLDPVAPVENTMTEHEPSSDPRENAATAERICRPRGRW